MSEKKRKRWIVKVPYALTLSARQREDLGEYLRKWYEEGPDPLVIADGCEVYGFNDQWDHTIARIDGELQAIDEIRIHEALGWQVCGLTDRMVVFKRPAPVEGPEDA